MSEKINVKVMTDQAFETCRHNLEGLQKNMEDHPTDASWLPAFVSGEPYQEKNFEIDDFSLAIPSGDDALNTHIQNGILLYETLNKLPAYILWDMRFWEWVTFEKGYRTALATIPADKVGTMWFGEDAGNNSRRGVMLHVLARSYVRVALTVEPEKEDKYELTRYLFKDERCYRNMVYRNISDIPAVSRAYVRADKTISEKYGVNLGDKVNRAIMKEISNIGSVRLIDAIPEAELYPMILTKLEAIVKELGLNGIPLDAN